MDFLVDWLALFSGPFPYLIIFAILLACGFGLPIPEDITLIAGGLITYYGLTELWPMIIISFAGVMIGDSIMFILGAVWGRKLTKKGIFHKLLPDERLNRVKKLLHDHGNKIIFFARFMPGLRAPMFFTAGTLHLPFRVFFFYDGLAALLSVPLIIGAVYHYGDELDQVISVIKRVEHGIIIFVLVAVLALVGKWYLSHRKLKRAQ